MLNRVVSTHAFKQIMGGLLICMTTPLVFAYSDGPELVKGVVDTVDLPSFQSQLDALEAEYSILSESYEEIHYEVEEIQESLDGYVTPSRPGSTLQVKGRIHLDMWNFPGDSPGVNGFETNDPLVSPQDKLAFRRIRIGVQGDLPRSMHYKIEVEYASANDTEFRDIYIGWKKLPFLQTLRVGNQKRPYGLDHLNSSNVNVFIERPFVVEGFNQDTRRLGIVSYGLSNDQRWNWRYGIYNQRLIQDEGSYTSDHFQGQIAGRIARTAWYDKRSEGRNYAHWAVSGTWANTDQNAATNNFAGSGINEAEFRTRPEGRSVNRWLDTGLIANADDYSLLGLESVVNIGSWQLVSEYQKVWLDRTAGSELEFDGAYAYISYFLTGEHIPWNRKNGTIGRVEPFEEFYLLSNRCGTKRGMGAWQIAARWSYADFSDQDILGGEGESITAGLNWYMTTFASMQFNYIYGEIKDNDFNAPAGAPNFGNYHILGTRLRMDF